MQTHKNCEKSHFGPDLGLLGSNLGRDFFFKNLVSSVTKYHGQLSSCTISLKTKDPILRKLSDGQKDRRTYRQDKFKINCRY